MNKSGDWRKQLQLWLILGITAGVLAAGFLLVPQDSAGKARLLGLLGTSNHGSLLAPVVPMAEVPLTADGEPVDWQAWAPRWRVVVATSLPCDEVCRELLYVTRQTHIRLARNADRVERVLLAAGEALDAPTVALIEQEHPQLRVVFADPGRFAAWAGAQQSGWGVDEPRVLVVDPQGVAMLYFTPEQEDADLLEDLNHLLKYSAEP